MPVSGNEEMGVKPSLIGIPMKKRRFPSKLTEDSLAPPTANKPVQKGYCSPPQESAISNDSNSGQFGEGIPIKKRRFPSQLTEDSLSPPTANDQVQKGYSSPPQESAISNDSDSGQIGEGIPVKKRRFPSISPNTHLSGDSPSLPGAIEQEQKGFSSLEVSTISNDSIGTSSKLSSVESSLNTAGAAGSLNINGVAGFFTAGSIAAGNSSSALGASNITSVAASISNVTSVAASVSSFHDASGKSVPEKEKRSFGDTNVIMVQGNSNIHSVKLEEQSFPVQSRILSDIDSKGKHLATRESENIMRKLPKSELDLVGKDPLTLNIGKQVYNQQSIDGKCRSQLPTVSGNSGLSLGLGDCLSDMGRGNNEHGFQNQEKAEPVSLDLSLRKEGTSQLRSITDFKPNNDGANKLADRTNWDLNTTMDSWEGSASVDDACQKTSLMDDMKLSICSGGVTATGKPTDQQMHEEIGHRAKTELSSLLSNPQYSTEDSLRLGLTTYLQLNSCEKPSSSSAKADSCKVGANICSPGGSVPLSNLKPVKPEPVEEKAKISSSLVKVKPAGSLNITKVKSEFVEKCISESSKSSTVSASTSVNVRSIKTEPVNEGSQGTPERKDGELNQADEQLPCPPDATTVPPTDLSLHGDVSTHVEHLVQAKEIETSSEGQVSSKMISSAGQDDVNESKVPGILDKSTSPNKNVEAPDYRMKFMDVQLPGLRGAVEGSASDEEKINLSADILEEDSYCSDYESGDNRELATATDAAHNGTATDDFEDGEIREPIMNTEIEVPICESQEAGNGNNEDTGYKSSDIVGFVSGHNRSPSPVKEKETLREDSGETNTDIATECIETSIKKDSTSEADKEVCLQEPLAVEMSSSGSDKNKPIDVIPRKTLDESEKDTVKGQEEELTSVQACDTSQETTVTVAQGADNAIKSDLEGQSNSVLPNSEAQASVNSDDAGKNVKDGGDRSRIINLPRSSNPSSPGRARSISGRMHSQVGRERLPDFTLEGDEFHPRGRDEAYGDGSHRFSRERNHDHPSRNSKIVINRASNLSPPGRTRSTAGRTLQSQVGRERLHDIVLEGGEERDKFHPRGRDEAYGDGSHRFSRERHHDHPSRNNRIGFMHRRGRVPSRIDNLRGDRDSNRSFGSEFYNGPTEFRTVRSKFRPYISPSRCFGEDGSELVGLRQMRGFADDRSDPMFSRAQASYEGLDAPFVQTRGIPRIRSKSPTRPLTRSPGPWPSFRRRSPDGFVGPSELPGEMVLRRDGSPPYLSRPSNDLRDLEPSRHPRSGIPNRSPSRRILHRNNRQLDLVDPRERNEGDDFFGRPMPSGRFHELGNDGSADERRRYGDRRGPVRPFRPPYSGADTLNYDLNAEGGPNSRFCPEDDMELHERGNIREREFDRRIKNRPRNPPRRTRNIDEEGNFRQGCQVWQDDGFDDMSRLKRRQF